MYFFCTADTCSIVRQTHMKLFAMILCNSPFRHLTSCSEPIQTHSAQKVSGLISNWNLNSHGIKTWVCLREGKFSKIYRVLLYFCDSHKNMDQIPESESSQSNSEYALPFQVKEEMVSSDEESGEISQPPQKTETSKEAFKHLMLLSSSNLLGQKRFKNCSSISRNCAILTRRQKVMGNGKEDAFSAKRLKWAQQVF